MQKLRLIETKTQITPKIAKHPHDRYIADLVDLSSYAAIKNQYKWILNVVDSATKFGWSRMLETKQTTEVCEAFREIFHSHGAPLILHTDNGGEFESMKMNELVEEFGIISKHGRARAP